MQWLRQGTYDPWAPMPYSEFRNQCYTYYYAASPQLCERCNAIEGLTVNKTAPQSQPFTDVIVKAAKPRNCITTAHCTAGATVTKPFFHRHGNATRKKTLGMRNKLNSELKIKGGKKEDDEKRGVLQPPHPTSSPHVLTAETITNEEAMRGLGVRSRLEQNRHP